MSTADPFTAACPLYRRAVAQRANTGSAFQVSGRPNPLAKLVEALRRVLL